MVDNLTDIMQRDWNLIDKEKGDRTSVKSNHKRALTNDSHEKNTRALPNHVNFDVSYDTDGGVVNRIKRHHRNGNDNYDYLPSPRISSRRHPFRERLSQKAHSRNDIDKYEEPNRHRLSIRTRQSSSPTGNHGVKAVRPFPSILSSQPLRIIFMRHSERANQALGPDWFIKAFRTNTYRAYDQNLPFVLPKRRNDQAYEFDPPLTVNGLQYARATGRTMMQNNLLVDLCLTSNALRCVQTCERILTGMDRRDRVPLRIEPGLFECPHYNQRIADSFMSKKELMDNRYNIKHDYKPIVSKVTVPETLDNYFDRSTVVMRAIIDRYGPYGGTLLLVTHAPGLLALTDALKGLRSQTETFYRNVSLFPPLAMYVAEYDGGKWKFSDQPFNILSTTTQF